MWEDPIVAEVRKLRQQLFAGFNYDLDAYVEHLKALQQKREATTGVYTPYGSDEHEVRKPDAA